MTDHTSYMYSDHNGTHRVSYNGIMWIEARSNYVEINSVFDGRKTVISKTLKKVEKELEGRDEFFRIHKSYIINLDYFDHLLNKDGGTVVLKNKTELLLARRRKPEFLERIARL